MADQPPKDIDALDELAATVAASLIEDTGMESGAAGIATTRIIFRVRREMGGRKHYFRRRALRDVDQMRADIGRRWNGRNTAELCREFDISETWLRELFAQHHGKRWVRR